MITKEDLKDYTTRDDLARIAEAVVYWTRNYNAVPGFPENDVTRDCYLEELHKQVVDFVKEVGNGA